MNTLELPAAVRAADQAMPRHTGGEILDHFRQKYPVVELDGREVFLFTSARGFGDRKHIVAFHSSEFATVPEHIYQYVLITYCYSGHFRLVVDNSAVTLGAGDCFVADRHVPHGVLPTGPDDIAINIILNDLVSLMDPKYIEVIGLFNPRGGISIRPFANHADTQHQDLARARTLAHLQQTAAI